MIPSCTVVRRAPSTGDRSLTALSSSDSSKDSRRKLTPRGSVHGKRFSTVKVPTDDVDK